jgi:hypothetical protein
LKKISDLPRGSAMCQVKFYWAASPKGVNSHHLYSMRLTVSKMML